jgi:hypothetical protein
MPDLEPRCSCDAAGAPEFPHRPCDSRSCRLKYAAGKRLRFPLSGNVYNITAVVDGEVTFARPDDPEDWTTETAEDLDAADVVVLP